MTPTAPARPMLRKPVAMAAAPEEPVVEEPEEPEAPAPEPEPVVLASPEEEALVVRVALEMTVELRRPVALPVAAVALGPSRVPVPTRGGGVTMGPGPVVRLPAAEVSVDAAEVSEDRPAESVGTR